MGKLPPMRRLYLVRHAQSRAVPGASAHTWTLTERGLTQAADLARQLRNLSLSRVLTSAEPKTTETARVLAGFLGVPLEVRDGLQEQARATAPWFLNEVEFRAAIEQLFAHPAERVFGEESANEAHGRFSGAVERVMGERDGDEIIVTHGTVLSLFISRANNLDTAAFWRSLGMPALVTLAWPSKQLLGQLNLAGAVSSPG